MSQQLIWHCSQHTPNALHCHSLFVEIDSVMVHSTSISTTSRMLPVLTCKGDQQALFFKSWQTFWVMTPDDQHICEKIHTNATMSVADMTSELPGLGAFGRLWRHVVEKVNTPVNLNSPTRPLLARVAKTTRESRRSHKSGQTRNAFQNKTNGT